MDETMTGFQFGDRVRHPRRPEWGTGCVTAVEKQHVNGADAQRVSVRFTNGGLKTIVTATVALELIADDEAPAQGSVDDRTSMQEIDSLANSGWLAGVAEQKLEERMIELPMDVRDPFDSIETRLHRTIDLFRFDRSGRGLMEWAIAQSGLDDPLARFARQDLEQFFDRWEAARADHLRSLAAEIGADRFAAALDQHGPRIQRVVRQITGGR